MPDNDVFSLGSDNLPLHQNLGSPGPAPGSPTTFTWDIVANGDCGRKVEDFSKLIIRCNISRHAVSCRTKPRRGRSKSESSDATQISLLPSFL